MLLKKLHVCFMPRQTHIFPDSTPPPPLIPPPIPPQATAHPLHLPAHKTVIDTLDKWPQEAVFSRMIARLTFFFLAYFMCPVI